MSNDKLADALEHTARHRAATEGIDPDQWRVVLFKWEALALQAHAAEAAQAQAQTAVPVATIRQASTGGYWIDWHGKQMPDYLGCDLYIHPPHRRTPMADTVKLQTDPDVIQLVQDRLDAARYRWLRNVANCDMERPYVVITREYDWGKSYDRLLDGLYLDAAIDAAMAKESGND